MQPGTDWREWTREALRLMQSRNDAWVQKYGLTDNPFHLDLVTGTLTLQREADVVAADLCMVGSVSFSAGTFLWAWANDAVPESARKGLERVRQFGEENGLERLIAAEWKGGRAEGLDMLAAAGRVLDAEGVWIDQGDDLVRLFVLTRFRVEPKP